MASCNSVNSETDSDGNDWIVLSDDSKSEDKAASDEGSDKDLSIIDWVATPSDDEEDEDYDKVSVPAEVDRTADADKSDDSSKDDESALADSEIQPAMTVKKWALLTLLVMSVVSSLMHCSKAAKSANIPQVAMIGHPVVKYNNENGEDDSIGEDSHKYLLHKKGTPFKSDVALSVATFDPTVWYDPYSYDDIHSKSTKNNYSMWLHYLRKDMRLFNRSKNALPTCIGEPSRCLYIPQSIQRRDLVHPIAVAYNDIIIMNISSYNTLLNRQVTHSHQVLKDYPIAVAYSDTILEKSNIRSYKTLLSRQIPSSVVIDFDVIGSNSTSFFDRLNKRYPVAVAYKHIILNDTNIFNYKRFLLKHPRNQTKYSSHPFAVDYMEVIRHNITGYKSLLCRPPKQYFSVGYPVAYEGNITMNNIHSYKILLRGKKSRFFAHNPFANAKNVVTKTRLNNHMPLSHRQARKCPIIGSTAAVAYMDILSEINISSYETLLNRKTYSHNEYLNLSETDTAIDSPVPAPRVSAFTPQAPVGHPVALGHPVPFCHPVAAGNSAAIEYSQINSDKIRSYKSLLNRVSLSVPRACLGSWAESSMTGCVARTYRDISTNKIRSYSLLLDRVKSHDVPRMKSSDYYDRTSRPVLSRGKANIEMPQFHPSMVGHPSSTPDSDLSMKLMQSPCSFDVEPIAVPPEVYTDFVDNDNSNDENRRSKQDIHEPCVLEMEHIPRPASMSTRDVVMPRAQPSVDNHSVIEEPYAAGHPIAVGYSRIINNNVSSYNPMLQRLRKTEKDSYKPQLLNNSQTALPIPSTLDALSLSSLEPTVQEPRVGHPVVMAYNYNHDHERQSNNEDIKTSDSVTDSPVVSPTIAPKPATLEPYSWKDYQFKYIRPVGRRLSNDYPEPIPAVRQASPVLVSDYGNIKRMDLATNNVIVQSRSKPIPSSDSRASNIIEPIIRPRVGTPLSDDNPTPIPVVISNNTNQQEQKTPENIRPEMTSSGAPTVAPPVVEEFSGNRKKLHQRRRRHGQKTF